jgi:hypothetical protein
MKSGREQRNVQVRIASQPKFVTALFFSKRCGVAYVIARKMLRKDISSALNPITSRFAIGEIYFNVHVFSFGSFNLATSTHVAIAKKNPHKK